MNVGLHLPQFGALATRDAVLAVARRADEVGVASLWVGDHLAFPVHASSPYPYSRDGSFPLPVDEPFLEAVTTMAVVAGATERVTIGASVVVAPLRDTITLARQVGTLAHLARRPVVLGVGGGWLREEFEALDRPFATRGRVLDEQLAAIRGLWEQPGYAHAGEHVSFPAVWAEPRPERRPELWVGGNGPAALRRAGRLGDAWHVAGVPDAETLAASMATVREAAAAAGRDPATVRLTARTGLAPGERGWASLLRRLDRLAAAGCDHVLVDPRADHVDQVMALCDAVAALAVRA